MKPDKYAIPRELSEGEETFARDCAIDHLTPEREYRFAPEREYRFDFAWPSQKIAVEIDGGTEFGKSRHSFGAGYERDARKFNLAVHLGWRVLRFTTTMVKSGEAIRKTLEAIND
jgi:very-short-patch-repair endonuclease